MLEVEIIYNKIKELVYERHTLRENIEVTIDVKTSRNIENEHPTNNDQEPNTFFGCKLTIDYTTEFILKVEVK